MATIRKRGKMTDKHIITCPKCKGTGKIYDIDWLSGLLSCGLLILNDLSNPQTCDTCNGKGWIYDR